jgi:hypothetical protein
MTSPFSVIIDGELLQKMVHQVFLSEFPLLFDNVMRLKSTVDDVAQHTWHTGSHHYGKLGHFPQHPTLVGDRPVRHIVHCEVWHALTHTGPIHDFWRQMVEGTSLFPKRNFPEEAFCMARRLVLMAYQVQDAPHPLD